MKDNNEPINDRHELDPTETNHLDKNVEIPAFEILHCFFLIKALSIKFVRNIVKTLARPTSTYYR